MAPLTWHDRTADDALAQLETSARDGLSDAEGARRAERYGPNRLPPPPRASRARILLDQLRSVVVLLLIAATAVSLLLGDAAEAAAIAAVLVINTALGFTTELRARRAMEAILRLDAPTASVVRDGRPRVVDAGELVPGDIIELSAGHQVPADARLLRSADLRTNEAALTGESLPSSKQASLVLDEGMPLADRRNMVFSGTTVASGVGRAVVTATGRETEVGRIGELTAGVRIAPTPLERRLDTLGHRLVWLALGVAALVAGLGALQGAPLDAVIQTAIALAVAAVPEALPAVATIALAVGMHRMAARHALVRRLPAVESLGSTTVICTDKTRTLTTGDMAVVRVWGFRHRVIEHGVLASRQPADDPVDRAIIAAAGHIGIDAAQLAQRHPEAGLVPFSSDRKLMASFRRDEGLVAYVKGAPTRVLRLCSRAVMAEGERPLDAAARGVLTAANDTLAGAGLRVLGVASGRVARPAEDALTDLTFTGLVGLADPPAPGVKETIARLRAGGLRTVMLTGDQRLTAEAIGRRLGVLREGDRAIEGRELDTMTGEQLREAVGAASAFSRITPEHKLRIVEALQQRGEIVAMLGDGVNDAPALRQADVGVAMGIRGTDVAREAAAIVLRDDRFETIAAAVEEGRVIFDNIRKFVFYLFSCNTAEILVLLIAGLAGLPLPLGPLQLLWLNMITDTFPALALAMEPAGADVMRRGPRRPDEAILSIPFVRGILLYGGLITASTLGAFVWGLANAPARATTMAFMTLALAQVAHLGNARSERDVLGARRIVANPYALGAVALSLGLQALTVLVEPLRRLLGVVLMTRTEWLVVIALAAAPAVIGQTVKLWQPRREP